MKDYWVIDSKLNILPESSLTQDGSSYYCARSIVPSESKESAIEALITTLRSKSVIVLSITDAQLYNDKKRISVTDEDFEVNKSFEKAKFTGAICVGCIVSGLSLDG